MMGLSSVKTYNFMALATNLVAYYKMDGNSSDSVGSANGSDTGITYSSGNGKINSGAGFVFASSSRITFASPNALNGLSKSISLWFKTLDSTHECYLFNGSNATNNTVLSILRLNPGTVSFLDIDGGGSNSLTTTASYNDGAWHHCVSTVNTAGTGYTIYIDGVSVKTFTAGSARTGLSVIANTATGNRAWETPGTSFFDGAIDEIGVWSRELTSSEVTTLYNAGAGNQYPFVEVTTRASLLMELM